MEGPEIEGEEDTVQNDLAALEELQNLDLQNLELRKELEDIPQTIEETRTNVSHIAEILDRERLRLEEAEKWRADREREIALQNELLAKSKAKLQVARNEKENKAAQREIDTIRKNIQEREKEALEVMEAIEQYRVAIDEHNKEFGELEKHLKATEEEGQARIDAVDAKIAETASRRAELASRVPQKLLRQYERIHARLGVALVEVVDGSCTGCNMGLPPQMYNELQRGDKLFKCPQCMRMLVFKKKDEPAEESKG